MKKIKAAAALFVICAAFAGMWQPVLAESENAITVCPEETQAPEMISGITQTVNPEKTAISDAEIAVYYDGTRVECPVSPFIENGRTLIPARALFEAMGAAVDYADDCVTIQNGGEKIEIKIGSTEITCGEKTVQTETPAKIIDETTFIPLRAAAEIMGKNVVWDGENRSVLIEDTGFEDKLNGMMPEDSNYMFSPLSIKTALAMLANGANGDTRSEMLSVLGIESLDSFNESVKAFTEDYSKTDVLRLSSANSIWLNTDVCGDRKFLESYKDTLSNYYAAKPKEVITDTGVEEINDWVNEKTNGKIPRIVGEDNRSFATALINAVYFKAAWAEKFYQVYEKAFTSRDGSTETVDFMKKTDYMNYSDTDGVKIVELPYQSYDYDKDVSAPEVSMYIMMSDEAFNPITELNRAQFCNNYIALQMPKFKIEYAGALNDMLKSMGMEKAFDEENVSGFDNMIPHDYEWHLYVDTVLHKTYIDVDEEGTEAAAVTAVIMEATGAAPLPEPMDYIADRPFTFVIKDKTNDLVLFMGEYAFAEQN